MKTAFFKFRKLTLAVSVMAACSGVSAWANMATDGPALKAPSAAPTTTQANNQFFWNGLIPLFNLGATPGQASAPSSNAKGSASNALSGALGSGLSMQSNGIGLQPVFAGNLGDGKALLLFRNQEGQFFASVIPLFTQNELSGQSSGALGSGLMALNESGSANTGSGGTASAPGVSSGEMNALASGSDSGGVDAQTNKPLVSGSTPGMGSSSVQPGKAGTSSGTLASVTEKPTPGMSSTPAESDAKKQDQASGTGSTSETSSSAIQAEPQKPSSSAQSGYVTKPLNTTRTVTETTQKPGYDKAGESHGSGGISENNASVAVSSEKPAESIRAEAPSAPPSSSAPASHSSESKPADYYASKPSYKPSESGHSYEANKPNYYASNPSSYDKGSSSSGSGSSGSSLAPNKGFLSNLGSVNNSGGGNKSVEAAGILSSLGSELSANHDTYTAELQDRAENYHKYSRPDLATDVVCASPQAMIRNQGEGDGYLANVPPDWTWSHAGHATSALGGWEHWPKGEQDRLIHMRDLKGNWQRLIPWFVISRVAGSHEPAEIEIGRMSLFYFGREDQQWHLLAYDMEPGWIGVCSPDDPAMVRCEAQRGGRIESTGTHNALHGSFDFVEVPLDAQALTVAVEARKIKGGPALMTAGADYYPPGETNLHGDAIAGAGASGPRRLKDNGDWTVVTMTTLADQTVDDTGIPRDLLMQRPPNCTNPVADT